MREQYIVVSDQEEDWKPVIKNFISEAALQGLIEIKKVRSVIHTTHEYDKNNQIIEKKSYGNKQTRIVLSEEAEKQGHDLKLLFNQWFNKTGIFKIDNKYAAGEYDEFN